MGFLGKRKSKIKDTLKSRVLTMLISQGVTSLHRLINTQISFQLSILNKVFFFKYLTYPILSFFLCEQCR
jgi:hypothetical protein